MPEDVNAASLASSFETEVKGVQRPAPSDDHISSPGMELFSRTARADLLRLIAILVWSLINGVFAVGVRLIFLVAVIGKNSLVEMDLVEVKGISKRKKCPCVLQVRDAWQILDELAQPYRTIVLIALCFGLRISEILGLRWTDFDFKRSVVLIQRSAVGKRLNKLKTEYSQDEVPIERGFILELKKWHALCLDSEGRWLFPSPVTGRPYHADSIRADHLVPTALHLGLGRIGFHTFRHTYRAWLDETGAPVGVQQKLMRHAHVSTTMDQYGNASALAKRKANRPIVQRLLRRSASQQVSIQ